MDAATIKLHIPRGDAKGLRTGEIFNWTGLAIAAPRTELEELLKRKELAKTGVYILTGIDPQTNVPLAYIGEAEVVCDRLKQHKSKEFWVSAIVFLAKDENLTKAHVRYLESRLLDEAAKVGRFTLEQNQASGARLPESDQADMESFLERIRQLLPVLGCELLTPMAVAQSKKHGGKSLLCKRKGALARGDRTANGFVIYHGSTAVITELPSLQQWVPHVASIRKQMIDNGTLVSKDGFLHFTKDAEFASPSTAAAAICGGNANGLTEWKDENGKTLKEIDENG